MINCAMKNHTESLKKTKLHYICLLTTTAEQSVCIKRYKRLTDEDIEIERERDLSSTDRGSL